MAKRTPPVGRVALAVSLLVVGVTLLVDNLFGYNLWPVVRRLWPLLPIALGLELLYRVYRATRKGDKSEGVAVDSVVIVFLALLALGGLLAWFRFIAVPARRFTVAIHRELRSGLPIAGGISETAVVRSLEEKVENLEGIVMFEFGNPRGAVYLQPAAEGEAITVKVDIRHVGGAPESLKTRALDADLQVRRTTGSVLAELLLPGDASPEPGFFAECRIWVPAGLDVRVLNSFGSVEVVGLTGNICVHNRFGKTEARGIRGAVQLQTEFGESRVVDAGASVEAFVSGGVLEVVAREQPRGNYRLATNMGNLRLTIPATADVTVEALAQMGAINTNLPLRVERIGLSARGQGVMGEGRVRLDLKASLGTIEITGR